jgi:hypothetical protein
MRIPNDHLQKTNKSQFDKSQNSKHNKIEITQMLNNQAVSKIWRFEVI